MGENFKIWNTYISPATDQLMDLGSDALQWNDLHLGGTAYLKNVTMAGNIDMNDFSLQNIAYLYGADSSDYIRMGISNRLIINITGSGTPFSTPDIDIIGDTHFTDDVGIALDKKLMFGDTGVYIFSDDDGHLDIVADTSIDINGVTNIGDGGTTNYSQFEADGTLKFVGAATVWDDIYLPISVTKPGAAAPTWATFQGNVKQYTFAINDLVHGSFEILHGYKEGTNLEVHCHIATNGAEASKEARYSFEYWIVDMDEASTTTTTLTSADKALTNADGHHEYVDLGDITGTGFKIGAIVAFVFKRVALVGGDSPSADPFVLSVGVHYERDTVGSRAEVTK